MTRKQTYYVFEDGEFPRPHELVQALGDIEDQMIRALPGCRVTDMRLGVAGAGMPPGWEGKPCFVITFTDGPVAPSDDDWRDIVLRETIHGPGFATMKACVRCGWTHDRGDECRQPPDVVIPLPTITRDPE